jgi:hypothetical protein
MRQGRGNCGICSLFELKVGMPQIRIITLLLALAALIQPALGQKKVSTSEAKDRVGEVATVCGDVVSSHCASTKGQPTFLNLDKPHPNPIFAVLIWGSSRSRFGTPENDYKEKRICATGKITEYRGGPEIVADNPEQIKLDSR